MTPRTREERETIIRIDETDEPAHLWTACHLAFAVVGGSTVEALAGGAAGSSRPRQHFCRHSSALTYTATNKAHNRLTTIRMA
jgi:hypothetical protein